MFIRGHVPHRWQQSFVCLRRASVQCQAPAPPSWRSAPVLALLDHPAVQGGAAPLVAALIVGLLLHRTRYAWLAIIAGYVTMIVLAGDFSFDPLTAGRKVVLMGFAAALAGVVLDALPHAPRRGHGVVAFINRVL